MIVHLVHDLYRNPLEIPVKLVKVEKVNQMKKKIIPKFIIFVLNVANPSLEGKIKEGGIAVFLIFVRKIAYLID